MFEGRRKIQRNAKGETRNVQRATQNAVKRNERSERRRKAIGCRNANHRTPSCLPEGCFAPLQCATLMSNRELLAAVTTPVVPYTYTDVPVFLSTFASVPLPKILPSPFIVLVIALVLAYR